MPDPCKLDQVGEVVLILFLSCDDAGTCTS